MPDPAEETLNCQPNISIATMGGGGGNRLIIRLQELVTKFHHLRGG